MRYAADQKAKTRARIVAAAGRVFRREGYHAAGVDKVMAEAGLTAGGFYAHFDSKQALLAEALEHAAAEIDERSARLDRESFGAGMGRGLSRSLPQSGALPRNRRRVPAGRVGVGGGAGGCGGEGTLRGDRARAGDRSGIAVAGLRLDPMRCTRARGRRHVPGRAGPGAVGAGSWLCRANPEVVQ